MKQLILTLLLLLPAGIRAQSKTTLVVELASGKADTYTLAASPSVTFSADGMTVACDGLTADYAIGDVQNWHFVDDIETSVEAPVSAAVRFVAPSVLAVVGDDVLGVTVSNLAGRQVMAASGSSLTIDLGAQAPGIYLVTINKKDSKQTIKIIKK